MIEGVFVRASQEETRRPVSVDRVSVEQAIEVMKLSFSGGEGAITIELPMSMKHDFEESFRQYCVVENSLMR